MSETVVEEIAGPGTRFARSHAVIIAVDAYERGIPRLQNAVRDGLQIGRVLGVDQGFAVRALFDRRATRADVLALLTELKTVIGPDDRLVVYLAGHGLTMPSDDGPNGFLLLQDAARDSPDTFLAMRTLHDGLAALPCRHLLLVLDCCFAATFRWAARRDIVAVNQVFRETFDRYVDSPAWQVMTSAASDQRALDVFGERATLSFHSPFAAAFLDGLTGKADLDEDGLVTATELYLYTRGKVELTTGAGTLQSPGLFPLRKHERGEFVFQVPNKPMRLKRAPELTPELNPYRGLESFDEAARSLFFGRERLVRELARAVLSRRLTVVVGPSGCGKSSIVKAGLVPMFRARTQSNRAARRWSVVGPIRAVDAATRVSDADLREGNMLIVIDQLEDVLTQSVTDEQRSVFLALLARWSTLERTRLVITVRSDYEPQLQSGPWSADWRAGRFVVPPMSQDQLRRAIEQPAEARELYFKPTRIVDDLINEVIQMPGALPLLSFTLSELYRHYFDRHGNDRAITDEDVDAVGGVTRALTLRATNAVDMLAKTDPEYLDIAPRVLLRMVATTGPEPARRRVPRGELEFSDHQDTTRADKLIEMLVAARLVVSGGEPDGEPYVEPSHDGLIRGWDRLALWRKQYEGILPAVRATGAAATLWQSHDRDPQFLWHGDPRLPQLVALDATPASPLNKLERAFVASSEERRKRRARNIRIGIGSVIAVLLTATGITYRARNVAKDQSTRAEQQRANALIELAPSLADPLQGALVLAEAQDASPVGWKAAMVARQIAIQTIPLSAQNPSGNQIEALALDASGRHALARDDLGGAWLLATDGRQPPLPLRTGPPIIDASFDHDGQPRALVIAADGRATVWSTEKHAIVATLQPGGRAVSASALAKQRAVLATKDGRIRVFAFDASSAAAQPYELALGSTDATVLVAAAANRAVAVTSDATGGRITVRAIALDTPGAEPVEVGSFALVRSPAKPDPYVTKVFLSDDGRYVTIYTRDFTRRTWDLTTLDMTLDGDRWPHTPEAADRTARCFAESSASGDVELWGECGDQKLSPQKTGGDEDDQFVELGSSALAFGTDDEAGASYVAVGAKDGTTQVWHLGRRAQDAQLLRTLRRHPSAISAVALRPDVQLLASGSRDGEIRIWPIDDPLLSDAMAPLFFTDGHLGIASTFNGVRGTFLAEIGGEAAQQLPGSDRAQVVGAWFDPDEQHVAVAYQDERVCSYRVKPLQLEGCCDGQLDPSFVTRATDGARLWVGFDDGSVQTCELATSKSESRLPSDDEPMERMRVVGFGRDPDGVIVAHRDGSLWKLADGSPPKAIPANDASIAAASADGQLIATMTGTGQVQLHRASDGWAPHSLGHHVGEPTTLAVSRDNSHVLTCSERAACSLWAVAQPGSKETFWPIGRYVEMSRDGSLVITAKGATFYAWSPSQPGRPIELGREDMQGAAAIARLSDDGHHLVTIWSAPHVGEDLSIPNERIAIWRMDWREIVRDVRARTTACLDVKNRAALLDERPDEAQRAHDRCVQRYGQGSAPVAPPGREAPGTRARRATPTSALPSPPTHGYVNRVSIAYSPEKIALPREPGEVPSPSIVDVEPVWNTLVANVIRDGGARLVPDREKFVGTFFSPLPLELPSIPGYLPVAGAARVEVSPWDAPRYPLMIECQGNDRRDALRLLTVPLAFADIVDLDAARAGRPSMPAQKLVDVVTVACAAASALLQKPMHLDEISPMRVLPEVHSVIKNLAGHRTSAADPKAIGRSIAHVEWPRDKVSPEQFAKLFGHPPVTVDDADE